MEKEFTVNMNELKSEIVYTEMGEVYQPNYLLYVLGLKETTLIDENGPKNLPNLLYNNHVITMISCYDNKIVIRMDEDEYIKKEDIENEQIEDETKEVIEKE